MAFPAQLKTQSNRKFWSPPNLEDAVSPLAAHVMLIVPDGIFQQGILRLTCFCFIVKFSFMVDAIKCSFAGKHGGGAQENCHS